MFAHLSIPLLLLAFAAAGAAVWVAGVYLANATSVLAKRFGLGQALGGLLLLAVVTNLPELALTVSAALSQHLELAIGNILGGIAMQTLVLVVLDVFGLGKKAALTYQAASLVLVLEGVLVLAAATSLPEVSTGLASMKAGEYQLAISDIFGDNAFLPVLFLVASALSGQAALPHAGKADLYLTGLGMLLTCVYVYGLVFRPQRQVARMGLDSLVVLGLYALGMLGLLAISS